MVKYAESSDLRVRFQHCRLADLGDSPGYLVIGLFAGPYSWLGRDGSDLVAQHIPSLQPILDQHPKLQLLLDYSWESGIGADFWDMIDEFVIALAVDPTRVVLLLSNSGLEERYAQHLRTHKRAPGSSYAVIGLELFLLVLRGGVQPQAVGGHPRCTDLGGGGRSDAARPTATQNSFVQSPSAMA